MGKVYDGIDDRLAEFVQAQPVWFVATAPLAADGHVNVSPKGPIGTLRVLGPHEVAYLDLIGSGAETVAHLRENGRIVVMLCAFEGPPKIVRLHGTARPVLRGAPGFDELVAAFAPQPGTRSVIVVDVTRVSDSCGYAVPYMELVEERETLDAVWQSRDDARIARYHDEKNLTSLDGLPGLPALKK